MKQLPQNMICVIPARGGSKRLRRKNLAMISGKPLITYVISSAQKSGLFSQVYVATEDKEIAQVAREHGAVVPICVPKKLTTDKIPSWAPCVFLADYIGRTQGVHYESLVCLQPTSVLVTAQDITNAVRRFEKEKSDFLVTVAPIDPHFFHWAVIPEKGGKKWKMYFGKKFQKDRLELPPVFRPNGAVKIARIDALKKQKNFFGKNLVVSHMDESRSLHIVSASDVRIAETLLVSSIKTDTIKSV